ncbi:GNAT family N-acetyltransferase [Paraburkholderia phymatum]|uniref:GNAT family N-acetyltransferase n=1 Tax=Paraburkholderia phymatum TaxID=148447 RepID=UPI00317EA008
MQKPHAVVSRNAHCSGIRHGTGSIVRRFDPARDSYAQLTAMLHRAFARLGMMGLNCTCVDQSIAVTQQRALAGDCFVAVCNGRIVGTMTLYARDAESPCELYQRDDVASVRQLGIDPMWQGRGIGKSMLTFAEHWAATRGFAELALDTPEPAAHLIAFYRAQGFRIVDTHHFDGKRYDSAILSKPPVAVRMMATWSRRLELPRAMPRVANRRAA